MAEEKIIVPDPALQAFVADIRKKEQEAIKPTEVEKPVSEEGKTEVPKPTEEPPKPAAVEAPKETKKEETPEKTEPPSSWDNTGETVVKPEASAFDFKSLGSALELGEIKDEAEFRVKVSELKTKLKQAQEQPLTGIPDEFKELVEITKKTGDWKSYLAESIVDYTKIDPIKLYQEQAFTELSKLARFRNADGSPKEQEILDEIASVSEVTRTVEGSRIQKYMIDQQNLRKATIVNQAKERLIQTEKELAGATKDLNQLLPFESYGIKFEAKHSNAIYEGVATSRLTKKHLGVSYEDLVRSGADMKAVAKTIASAEYGEQMLKFKSDAALVKAKKEVLAKVENVQLTPPAVPAAPETKTKSAWETYRDKIVSQRNSF
jgi:hypothetical protein